MNQSLLIKTNNSPQYIEEMNYIPVTNKKFFVIQIQKFNYYAVDLRNIDFERIKKIVKGCESVETECWNPQEEFSDYIKKSDILLYAEIDGRIVGFNLVSLLDSGTQCIYSVDEAMVLKEYRGKNIARNLVIVTTRWYLLKFEESQRIKQYFFLSISPNPKVVNNYFKNKYITSIFETSFNPSQNLKELQYKYIVKNKLNLVDPQNPFCIQGLFPKSNKLSKNDKLNDFSKGVRKKLPENFDHIERGDSFAFMFKISKRGAQIIQFLLLQIFLGRKLWTDPQLGIFGKEKHVHKQKKEDNSNFVEKRSRERRIVNIGYYLERNNNRRNNNRRNSRRRSA